MTDDAGRVGDAGKTHDFKLIAIHHYASSTPEIPSVSRPLAHTCQVLGDNLHRIRSTVQMLSIVIHFSCLIERCHAVAELEIDGKLGPKPLDSLNFSVPIIERVRQLYHEFCTEDAKIDGTKEGEKEAHRRLSDALNRFSMISTSPAPQMVNGVNGMLASLVLGMWTTFETFAGDLWEAALNAHPAGLADLKGYAKRMVKGDKQQESPLDTSKEVRLDQLQRYGFDIKNRMGTILRARYGFDSLYGIREAYALAFSKHYEKLDAELKNRAFDALSALRNVIMHKGGICDAEYKRHAASWNLLPNYEIGKPIILDGLAVSRLLHAAERSAIEILHIVDLWITEH